MKKISIFIISIFILLINTRVFAAKSNETVSSAGSQIRQQNQQQLQISASPTGNKVQNQNQVETQNQKTDSQLRINNQEKETLNDRQELEKQMQKLLQIKTEKGDVEEKIGQIVQEQNQAQNQIKEQLNNLESKNQLTKFLIGSDYQTLKKLKEQHVQNRARIGRLTQLQSKLNHQDDIVTVQETIQILLDQNVFLQNKITSEEQSRSLFGWLFKLFAK